uniref:B9 domain-containing protein 2 n=1 Tax=Timema monikensis TaxID=170555 RepID=A0A7R9EJ31_9NEOP|nr:unnamed protein product [Timema monikensis]
MTVPNEPEACFKFTSIIDMILTASINKIYALHGLRSMAEVHILGQILGASEFPKNTLFCKWGIHAVESQTLDNSTFCVTRHSHVHTVVVTSHHNPSLVISKSAYKVKGPGCDSRHGQGTYYRWKVGFPFHSDEISAEGWDVVSVLDLRGGWKVISGLKDGQTHVDNPEYDEAAHWCHPLDVHFATKGIQGR